MNGSLAYSLRMGLTFEATSLVFLNVLFILIHQYFSQKSHDILTLLVKMRRYCRVRLDFMLLQQHFDTL